MMARALARRLALLETRLLPPVEWEPHTINFVEVDGTVTCSLVLGPNGASQWTYRDDLPEPVDGAGYG